MRQSALGGMGCGLRALGGATTTASVLLARAYASRSVPAESPVSRSPGSSSMSVAPAASQRRMISAAYGCSAADRVTRTCLGTQSRDEVTGRGSMVDGITKINVVRRPNLPLAVWEASRCVRAVSLSRLSRRAAATTSRAAACTSARCSGPRNDSA